MKDKKTGILENGLIWFGAAVSIAEIMTGTFLAPLGLFRGLAAILLGHLIGCALFYFAGLIGAKTEKSAMETVKLSFGQKGSILFSSLNVLQLIGWTAIMIVIGANSADLILSISGAVWSPRLWSLFIGALILFWVLVGIRRMDKLNMVAMAGLFILSVIHCTVIFKGKMTPVDGGGMTFGQARRTVSGNAAFLAVSSFRITRGLPKRRRPRPLSAVSFTF
jgi:putative hydroxymethylpyrimidine transporter CytX